MKKKARKKTRLHKSLPPVFAGEWMTCIMCGKQHQSNATVESNWRALDVDGQRFYACPEEFPLDDAPATAFSEAYMKIFVQILTRRSRNGSGR